MSFFSKSRPVEQSKTVLKPPDRENMLWSILRELPFPKRDEDDTPTYDSSPLVRLINATLVLALDRQATDIVWEPVRGATRVRCGMPGFMSEIFAYPPHLHQPIVQRFQTMADLTELDLARPQAGIIRLRHNNQDFDFRITWIPTQFGGKIHARIHNRKPLSLREQGIHPLFIPDLMDSLNKKKGMMLFVGPPGCGKTILASQLLWMLDPENHSVHTLEWPVEVSLFGGTQTPRHPIHGPTPMEAVKAALRAGADTFFLSTIDDEETAAAAFYAVEAGLGLVATMDLAHPERVGSILKAWGISPERQQRITKTIVAPHRLPALCPDCRTSIPVTEELSSNLFSHKEDTPEVVYTRSAEGCETCYGQGVVGSRQLLERWNIDGTSHKWLGFAILEEVIQGNLGIEEAEDCD